jgi:hypothetical protein
VEAVEKVRVRVQVNAWEDSSGIQGVLGEEGQPLLAYSCDLSSIPMSLGVEISYSAYFKWFDSSVRGSQRSRVVP